MIPAANRSSYLGALNGLLGFPVTPFGRDGNVDLDQFRVQVARLVSFGISGIFPACGTGEMQSLTPAEFSDIVRTCVDEVDARVPVFAGIGFGFGHAVEMGTTVTSLGADGVLVFPPYSGVAPDQLVSYYEEIAGELRTNLIVYQRDSAVFTPRQVAELATIDNVLGLKDGTGRVDLLRQQVNCIDLAEFAIVNGTPTAELTAPALATCGIRGYSSAILNFLPEVALEFHRAIRSADSETIDRLMMSAVLPFADIRDRRPGYHVALVKAGLRLRGFDVGGVRPPLNDPSVADYDDLRHLLVGLGIDIEAPAEAAPAVSAAD